MRNAIQQMLGARVITDCEKYLSLPMACGKYLKELQEKISKRVIGRKEKFIFKAGQKVLINIVVQAIPTYSMSLFRLPKSIWDNINSLLAKYW